MNGPFASAPHRRTARRDAPPAGAQPQTRVLIWTRKPIPCAAWLTFENKWPDPRAMRMAADRDSIVLEYQLPPAKAGEYTMTRTKNACPHVETITTEQFIPAAEPLALDVEGAKRLLNEVAALRRVAKVATDTKRQLRNGLAVKLASTGPPGHVDYINKRAAGQWCDLLADELEAALAGAEDACESRR